MATTERRALATGCEGDRCASWGSLGQAGARVDLRAHDAVGIWGSFSYATHSLSGTGHNGRGTQAAAGLHVQWPRDGLRPALAATGHAHQTATLSSGGSTRSTTTGRSLRVAGLAVGGSSAGGATGWLGPTLTALETNALDVRPDDVQVTLTARNPVGVVLGGELTSDALGPEWRRSTRMVLGAEAQLVDVWGLSAWLGVTY